MAVMVSVEMKFKPESAEKMLEIMKTALVDTRGFEGCQELKSYYETETYSLLFIEIWDSAAAQQAYLGWRVESGFIDSVSDDMAAPPVIRTFEIREDI
jgi:quinol monooxygenase YgiN